MSRFSFLTWSLALLSLGAGAIGYGATGAGVPASGAEDAPTVPAPPVAEPALGDADAAVLAGAGESLTAALLRAGVGGLDAALVDRAAEGIGAERTRPLRLWFDGAIGSDVRALERMAIRIAPGRWAMFVRTDDDFTRREFSEQVDVTPVRLRLDGAADELPARLVEAGLPRDLRDSLVDRIGRQSVAAIDLLIAHEEAASGSTYGAPLYLGLHRRDGSVQRWVGSDGALRPMGTAAAPSGLLRPLPGAITSSPGLRLHPILRYLRWHRGTDFAAPSGTPVQAAMAGRVIEAGWRGGYGRTVRMAHADGSSTLYAHLRAIDVAAGEMVAQGALVGEVGASGLATGPHLHFEWLRDGAALRPDFAAPVGAGGSLSRTDAAALQSLLAAPFRLAPGRRG